MSEEYEEVKTNDMGMAAYLKLEGHQSSSVEWDSEADSCFWTFPSSAVPAAQRFMANEALVNPREFTRAYGECKRDLHEANKN